MAIILAEGAIALSVTHSGGALFASWKLLPIPVKFDRQGHSCNFYGGFGPTSPKYHSSECNREA